MASKKKNPGKIKQTPRRVTIDDPVVAEIHDKLLEVLRTRPTKRARFMRDIYEAWVAGLSGEIPEDLKRLETKVAHEKDPEYREYLRLKKKFES